MSHNFIAQHIIYYIQFNSSKSTWYDLFFFDTFAHHIESMNNLIFKYYQNILQLAAFNAINN